jgi:hypothetical protein
VGEVGRSQRLGRDLARLEQLQRDLTGGRELGSAPDHEHPGDRGEGDSYGGRQPLELGQVLLELSGHLVEQPRQLVAPAGEAAGEEGDRGQLGRVGLRRRHRELGARGEWEHRLGGLREIGVGLVRDRNRERAATTSALDVVEHVLCPSRL